MIYYIILALLTILTAATVGFPSSLLTVTSFIVGTVIVSIFDKNSRKTTSRIYLILFSLGWVYMLMCYLFMTGHNLQWLLAYDSYNAFIPTTEKYMNAGNGHLLQIYKCIFEDYNIFLRNEYFYWSYTCTWGVIINRFNADLYYGLQNSTLFLYPFVGVVLYKLFEHYGFDEKKSERHTLVICLLSIIFFYSSQILRDIPVLLCYLIAFYLSAQKNFSLWNLLELLLVIFITCGLRIESGLFLMLTIPAYLLLTMKYGQQKFYAVLLSMVVIILTSIWVFSNFNNLQFVASENFENYTEGIDKGNGMIGLFQRIPILGDFISIIYNASQPIPCWGRLSPSANSTYGLNAYNIMNFTRIPAAFFNILVWVTIFVWLFSKSLRNTTKQLICSPLRYQLWIGLLFLYLQSAVVSQRRLMGYYCIFYILMFAILDNSSKETRKNVYVMGCGVFVALQMIGIFYF